jgi:hypothetical protein
MTFFESSSRSIFLFEHDLFGKPVSTFPDHALPARGIVTGAAADFGFSSPDERYRNPLRVR